MADVFSKRASAFFLLEKVCNKSPLLCVFISVGKSRQKGKKMKVLMMAALAVFTCVAWADDKPARPERRGPAPAFSMVDNVVGFVLRPKMAEQLQLTNEQKEKIKEMRKAGREINREAQKSVGEAMRKQMKLLEADSIDEAAVMAAIDEVFEAKKQIAKNQTKRLIELKGVLTKEQLELARKAMTVKRPPRERRGRGSQEGRKGCDKPADPAPEAK